MAKRRPLDFRPKPTGSLTEKVFSILEGATVLVVTADSLAAKIRGQPRTISIPTRDVEVAAKQLREAATMIEALLAIIEERELAATPATR